MPPGFPVRSSSSIGTCWDTTQLTQETLSTSRVPDFPWQEAGLHTLEWRAGGEEEQATSHYVTLWPTSILLSAAEPLDRKLEWGMRPFNELFPHSVAKPDQIGSQLSNSPLPCSKSRRSPNVCSSTYLDLLCPISGPTCQSSPSIPQFSLWSSAAVSSAAPSGIRIQIQSGLAIEWEQGLDSVPASFPPVSSLSKFKTWPHLWSFPQGTGLVSAHLSSLTFTNSWVGCFMPKKLVDGCSTQTSFSLNSMKLRLKQQWHIPG